MAEPIMPSGSDRENAANQWRWHYSIGKSRSPHSSWQEGEAGRKPRLYHTVADDLARERRGVAGSHTQRPVGG